MTSDSRRDARSGHLTDDIARNAYRRTDFDGSFSIAFQRASSAAWPPSRVAAARPFNRIDSSGCEVSWMRSFAKSRSILSSSSASAARTRPGSGDVNDCRRSSVFFASRRRSAESTRFRVSPSGSRDHESRRIGQMTSSGTRSQMRVASCGGSAPPTKSRKRMLRRSTLRNLRTTSASAARYSGIAASVAAA